VKHIKSFCGLTADFLNVKTCAYSTHRVLRACFFVWFPIFLRSRYILVEHSLSCGDDSLPTTLVCLRRGDGKADTITGPGADVDESQLLS
jgi:hypothetical protein